MLISQKSEYAIRALVDIAGDPGEKPVNRSDISQRQQIPLPYLTQVLRALVNGKILNSLRGPSGGYALNLPPEDISLLDVVTLLQGPVSPAQCAGSDAGSGCDRFDGCGLVDVWSRLKSANEQVLGQTTLEDLLPGSARGADTAITPDTRLDCIGLHCPLPIVRMSEVMMDLGPGQVLEVWADDEGAKADIPAWCTGTGNDFLSHEEYDDQMKFLIRKAI